MKRALLLTISFLTAVTAINAQSLVGYNHSRNELLSGIFTNPANIAGSAYKADVNIFTLNTYVTNTAFAFKPSNGFENDDWYKIITDDSDNNLYFNTDIMLPSFILSLGNKHSIGLTTRVRFLMSATGMDEGILRLVADEKSLDITKTYNAENMFVNAHGFADIGLSYGIVFYKNNNHLLKAGITAKYYMGLAAASAQLSDTKFQMQNSETFVHATGNMNALYSAGIDDLIDGSIGDFLSNISKDATGFGVDFGIAYEWKNPNPQGQSSYKLRASVAVTDLGKLKYKTAPRAALYSLDIPSGTTLFDFWGDCSTLDEFLQNVEDKGYFTEGQRPTDFSVLLPTYFRATVDANLYKGFFVNLNVGINMKSNSTYGAAYSNIYVVTPRWESGFFGISSPIGYSDSRKVFWGAGLNFGPCFLGSSNAFTSLLANEMTAIDVYLGFHIPIGRKNKIVKENKN